MLHRLHCVFLFSVLAFLFQGCANKQQKSFVLWQLPSQTPWQMNSYVIKTVNGKIIVLDGGYKEDAPYLKGFLAPLGNEVHMWFISHQHSDHIDALAEILRSPGDVKIRRIYGSLLDAEWGKINDGNECFVSIVGFNNALAESGKQVDELELGQKLTLDGVSIKVLGVKNPEITANGINNSSIVMKIWDKKKSILFPGDLAPEGGQKLLNSQSGKDIESDYVQMAHHGQWGVDEEFYKAVNPKYCIWPTPLWLWDNDSGNGKGSGPWKTMEVRGWMEDLKIHKHYFLFDGLVTIE